MRILCAAVNAFGKPLIKDTKISDQDVRTILIRKQLESDMVAFSNVQDLRKWKKIDINNVTEIIPSYTLEDLRQFAFGPYPLKLANPYLYHSRDFKFYTHKSPKYPNVIKVTGMKSRYKSNKNHLVFINFEDTLMNSMCCCTCKSGLRTVGACVHIISVLYFIGQTFGKLPNVNFGSRSSHHINTMTDIHDFVSQRNANKKEEKETELKDTSESMNTGEFKNNNQNIFSNSNKNRSRCLKKSRRRFISNSISKSTHMTLRPKKRLKTELRE